MRAKDSLYRVFGFTTLGPTGLLGLASLNRVGGNGGTGLVFISG